MRWIRMARWKVSRFPVAVGYHLELTHISCPTVEACVSGNFTCFRPLKPLSYFSTSSFDAPVGQKVVENPERCSTGSDSEDDDDMDDDDDKYSDDDGGGGGGGGGGNEKPLSLMDDGLAEGVKTIMDILQTSGFDRVEMKNMIERCGVKASRELVLEVLSRMRNDWETAFMFFLWAGKQTGYSHSVREYHSLIAILGKMRKFDTAWLLIDEMKGSKTGMSIVTPQTLLIMIRRYSAAHDVGKAINTFYAHKRFKFDVGIEEFQGLLSALCRYKNVQDAEHMMFCNKDIFPLNTKSFNIVLNGWCNAIGSPREAERVWREMGKRGFKHDVVSYSCIISCYSKAGSLHRVLKLYNRMKETGIEPDRKVYNGVVHSLAKGKLVKEAVNLMHTMEKKRIPPNIVTYNSLIKPLCRARKLDEARTVFDEMLHRGLSPTVRTYHAFFRILRTAEEAFALLDKMRKLCCQPTTETYIMLTRKFCRWRQLDNVTRLWNDMRESGISPDRSSYIVLIHGLFLNGKLDMAYKYYEEMKEKELLPEPKIDHLLQTWLSNKHVAESQLSELRHNTCDNSQTGKHMSTISKKSDKERHFLRQPETRIVVRERGFSFWKK